MSPGRLFAYAITASIAYLVTVVVTAPASWLARALEQASADRLHLREVSGTVWTGSARLVVRTPDRRGLDLGVLRWTARPSGLLPPRIGVSLRASADAPPVLLEISPARIAVEDLDLKIPGSMLPSFAPVLASFGPRGTVHVRSESLRLERDAYFGLAEVEWQGAALASQPGLALGSHIARLRGAGERVDIDLGTLEGPLQLSGKATWRPNASFEIAGSAQARTPEARAFLRSVCAVDHASTCPFAWRSASAEATAARR
ncbi:MAG TPA: type II secretion system protein N [Burkholderiales bacterium]|nr:type II secretion system protein N [Burkholderiales bacterium]